MKTWLSSFFLTLLLTACSPAVATQAPTHAPTLAPTSVPVEPTKISITPSLQAIPTPELTHIVLTMAPLTTPTSQPLIIYSPSFKSAQPIPSQYTCDGENISPVLKISGVPKAAASLALIMDDPDAPSGTYTHWVLYNLQPSLSGLVENIQKASEVQGLGTQGINSSSRIGYFGPCPPAGTPHRYYFKLFALDLKPDLPAGLNATRLMEAIKGHILAQTEWMGTYQRK